MSIVRRHAGPRMAQAVEHGSTIYLAGQVAEDKQAGVGRQTEQVLAAIDRLLAECGSSKAAILSTTVYLADIADFAEMNAAWERWVDRGNPPARATVEARLVAPEYRVEIAVIAAKS